MSGNDPGAGPDSPTSHDTDSPRDDRRAVPWRGPGAGAHALRLALAGLLLLIYIGSVLLYVASLDTRGVEAVPEPAAGAFAAVLDPTSIRPQEDVLDAMLLLDPGSEFLDEDGLLRQDVYVNVYPVLGDSTAIRQAGTPPSPLTLRIPVDGSVENYPFDSYAANLVVTVTVATTDGGRRSVPVVSGVAGDLVGWSLREVPVDRVLLGDLAGVEPSPSVAFLGLSVGRAGSTVAISLLIIVLMVVLAVLGGLVARSVVLRRRKIEVGLASWFGALLFAMVPLRGFLPGAPPLGSWIDILIVFWVEIVLMVSLALFVGSWLSRGARPD